MQIKWKAVFLLLVLCAMQLSLLLKGLHHHEHVCLLHDTEQEQQVLHPHAEEHNFCAWAGAHFSVCTFTLHTPIIFVPVAVAPVWAASEPAPVQLFSGRPTGRGPPSPIA